MSKTFRVWLDFDLVSQQTAEKLLKRVARLLPTARQPCEHPVTSRRGKVVGHWGIYESEQYRGTGGRT